MAIRFNAWMLALMGALLASPAMADDEGPYIALTVGRTIALNSCMSPSIALGTPCYDNRGGLRATFGYQYTPMWALEGSYGDMGQASSYGTYPAGAPQLQNSTAIGPASFGWTLIARGWTFAGVGTIHLSDDLSVFGKAGGVAVDIKQSNVVSATNGLYSFAADQTFYGITFGGGIQYDLTPKVALRAQYENFGSYAVYVGATKVNLNMISGGMVVKY